MKKVIDKKRVHIVRADAMLPKKDNTVASIVRRLMAAARLGVNAVIPNADEISGIR